MKKIIITLEILAVALIITLLALPTPANNDRMEQEKIQEYEPELTEAELELIHRQETWISALEWFESRGRNSAVNPQDRDGTPSYSNFQWKPSTFIGYAKKYELIPRDKTTDDFHELVKDYELQREIVRRMINDPDVNFYNEFPDVTRNKIGLPPR